MAIDLLKTVTQGGCSAKLSAQQLALALKGLPKVVHENLLVSIDTHDDAGVYKINETTALIQTTDFFSPICSDPYDFGVVAAANAFSDVYAMGGIPLTALNIVLFPSQKMGLEVLQAILMGGMDSAGQAGALIIGGHTIDDDPIKYGLAVTGVVHPQKVITNAAAQVGDVLILTKPIGCGIIIAATRIGQATAVSYQKTVTSMKQLNNHAAAVMQEFGVRAATDITGFGLVGHVKKMASASGVSFHLSSSDVPLLPEAFELADKGCIPSAAFRNLEFVDEGCCFHSSCRYTMKMVLCDSQTSGGILMCVGRSSASAILDTLHTKGYDSAACVGSVVARHDHIVEVE
ncbi:MAG: selenide, water dikinase SelD [Chitinivibrionales bacterium]|nr:selenide, water dikinase SelD [Chitinivibrionales bacterium]